MPAPAETPSSRRFALGLLAGALAALVAWLALVAAQLGVSVRSTMYPAAALAKKRAIAAAATRPKIVVVAGSTALFSVRARRLGMAFGRPAVNMGLFADLGLDYLFDVAGGALRAGDAVLLPLEYEHYRFDRAAPSDAVVGFTMAADPGYMARALPPWQALRWLLAAPERRVFRGLWARVRPPVYQPGDYRPETIDAWGDETLNAMPLQRPRSLGASFTLMGPEAVSADARAALGGFVAACRARGVSVWATWPSLAADPRYANAHADALLADVRRTWAVLGVPVVGEPRAFMAPARDFYDTHYHLSAGPADAHTEDLIRLLRASGFPR